MNILYPYPPLSVSRERLHSLICAVLMHWGDVIEFESKQFGPDQSYTCRSILPINDKITRHFDSSFHKDLEEIFGIVTDVVGKAIKHTSLYTKKLEPINIDVDMIINELAARDDLMVD